MGLTKKAKPVKVTFEKVEGYVSVCTCPTCKVEYHGNNINKNTIQFRCDCGQILKIK